MKKITILLLFIAFTLKAISNTDTTSSVRFSGIKNLTGNKSWEGVNLELMNEALLSMDSIINAGNGNAEDYFNRGALKSALSDDEGAMKDYDKAITIDNKFYNALVNRAILFQNQRKYTEALTDLNKIIKLYPDRAIPYNNRGFMLQAQKKYEEAIVDYTKSFELDKEYINPFVNKIRCYILLGKFKEAKSMCSELMIKYKTDPKVYVEISDFYIAFKDLDSALYYLDKGIIVSNKDPEMYIFRSQFKDDVINDDWAAVADCDSAIAIAPKNPNGYYARCRPLFDLKKYDLIISNCSKAIVLDSTLYEAWVMRGDAYDLTGNIEFAKKDYEHAIYINPKRDAAYTQLTVLYSSRNDLTNAMATLDRLIKADPLNEKGLSQRASGKLGNKDFAGAKKDLSVLNKINPDDTEVLYYLAITEDSLGEKNNACKHMKIADDIDQKKIQALPVRTETHEYLRTHCRELIPPKALKGDDLLAASAEKEKVGNYKEAMEILSKLIVLFPDSAAFYYGRGKEKRKMDDYEGAITDYKKALTLNSNLPEALVSMGVAQQLLDRKDEALETYLKTIEVAPENEMAYNNIGVILSEDKKYSEAIVYFKKAVSIKNDYLTAIMHLGMCYEETGDKVNACKMYTKAEMLGDGSAISKKIFNCW